MPDFTTTHESGDRQLGIFGKKSAAVVPVAASALSPVPTELNSDWFHQWARQIIDESGVDPADELNTAALMAKASALLQHSIKGLMEKNSGMWAWPQVQSYLASPGATPWGALELVAGWKGQAIPLLKEELERFAVMLIPRGRADGTFRHEW